MTIKAKNAARIAHLLNEHENITEAIARLKHPKKFEYGVTVSNEKNDSDFVSVGLDNSIAHVALHSQRDNIEHELGLLGVDVER
jgi:hypothetical protein